jgi:DNA-binding Lrp family transcriptional regulator
MGTGSGR